MTDNLPLEQALLILRAHTEGGKNAHLTAAESRALRQYIDELEQGNLANYVQSHIDWSRAAFGDGDRTEGLLKHIAKELDEVRKEPMDVYEWVDIIILAIDGAWRATGLDADDIASALVAKQAINIARRWPKPVDGQPTEHIKE